MDQQHIVTFLKGVPLFRAADERTLSTLCERAELQSVRRGEALSERGDRLCVLLSGRAQIRSADDGRQLILRTLQAGNVFGAAALFLRESPTLSQVTALEDCAVLYLDRVAVRELMREDMAFCDAYLSFLADRVRFLNQKIRCFTAGSALRRLALWLAAEESDVLTLSDSLRALAAALDIGRASLYRALDTLTERKLIAKSGRTIQILDRAGLLNV